MPVGLDHRVRKLVFEDWKSFFHSQSVRLIERFCGQMQIEEEDFFKDRLQTNCN